MLATVLTVPSSTETFARDVVWILVHRAGVAVLLLGAKFAACPCYEVGSLALNLAVVQAAR